MASHRHSRIRTRITYGRTNIILVSNCSAFSMTTNSTRRSNRRKGSRLKMERPSLYCRLVPSVHTTQCTTACDPRPSTLSEHWAMRWWSLRPMLGLGRRTWATGCSQSSGMHRGSHNQGFGPLTDQRMITISRTSAIRPTSTSSTTYPTSPISNTGLSWKPWCVLVCIHGPGSHASTCNDI